MPDTLPAIRTQLITDEVYDRLDTLTDVTVYRSEMPTHPPAAVGDPEGRVSSYVVLYPFGPKPTSETDLADQTKDMDYSMQVTCVAGYSPDAEYLWDRVHALIYRWSPTVTGVAFGGFRPPTGYQPGPLRRNEVVKPPRFWVPLQYVLITTT